VKIKFDFPLCQSKIKSENTQKKIVVLKSINKKGSGESSRSVCSADLEDSLGKEQLYRWKITILMFEITIVAIMKLCLFNSIGS